MSSSRRSRRLRVEELLQAVANVSQFLSQSGAQFSISGGAAASIIRMQYGLPPRVTDDIDLVVQPRGSVTAESISSWLLENFPEAFVQISQYGIITPALAFQRRDGTVKNIDIEIFDVHAWPHRPQYNLDDPENDSIMVPISGVQVPVFSARWLLREKVITAFERQGSRKEETDLDDACALLEAVELNELDLTGREEAVRHIVARRPDHAQLLELKIVCRAVFGEPWTWHESAGVHWRFEGNELRYLDGELRRHGFEWDAGCELWYLTDNAGRTWYYSGETGDLEI
ncbi:hypothetical protein ACJ41O_000245 [Fusarium nematophilum]